MEKQYYIASKNSRLGPFTLSQLKERNIDSDTLIWCEGMEQWTKAGELDELKSAIPPPTPFQIESQIKKEIISKTIQREKMLIVTPAMYTGVVFCIMFLGMFGVSGGFEGDKQSLVDAFYNMGVYTTKQDVISLIAGISLFWSFLFSIICFVILYLHEKRKNKQNVFTETKEEEQIITN